MDDQKPIPYNPFKKPKQSYAKQTVKRLVVVVIAILVVSTFIQLFGPAPTGYVIVVKDTVDIKEMAYQDSTIRLSSQDQQSIPLKSLKLSGTIIGDGRVDIYLLANNQKHLAYTNAPKGSTLPIITGFAVKDHKNQGSGQGSKISASISDLELKGEQTVLSDIKLQVQGNELGMLVERINISWYPDNGEKIEGIRIGSDEFWSYDQRGKQQGRQSSGTILEGWGQKLPNNLVQTINSIAFDSSMQDKLVILEIYFRDFVDGFRVGNERKLSIHLDLSGRTESFIEEEGVSKQTFVLEKVIPSNSLPIAGEGSSDSGTGGSSKSQGINQIIDDNIQVIEFSQEKLAEEYGNLPSLTGYSILEWTQDGKLLKGREIEPESINFQDNPDLALNLTIIEDLEYKNTFEQIPIDEQPRKEIVSGCEDTCVLGVLNDEEYELEFDVEEGTAVNLKQIEFS